MILYKHKYFILILYFFLFNNSYSQDYWKEISSPVNKTLTNCSFINSNTGWISGDSGTIIRTTNGGVDWTVQNSNTVNNIEDIFFLNERLGWAVSYEIFPDSNKFLGTLLLKTTDGGNNWITNMYPDTNIFLNCVFYNDSLTGFLGGISALILKTTDGGNNWMETDTDSGLVFILPVFKIKFINDNLGYACGGFRDIAGITWVTTNGGIKWTGTVLAPEPFFDLTILNNQKTICSGGDLEYGSSIARTTNQGVDWYYDTLGVFGLARGIDNINQSEIWMASGFAEKFLYSSDTGNTWTSFDTPGNVAAFDVEFTDSVYGYSCGMNGAILKYDKSMSSVITVSNIIGERDFTLYQNYPNPFNPKTIISYKISENEFVILKVYDVLGNEIKTLVNEKQLKGNYNYTFNAENLPSGIYYYKLSAEGESGYFTEVKKMAVIK